MLQNMLPYQNKRSRNAIELGLPCFVITAAFELYSKALGRYTISKAVLRAISKICVGSDLDLLNNLLNERSFQSTVSKYDQYTQRSLHTIYKQQELSQKTFAR